MRKTCFPEAHGFPLGVACRKEEHRTCNSLLLLVGNWQERNRPQGLAGRELSKTKCESRITGTPGRTEKTVTRRGTGLWFQLEGKGQERLLVYQLSVAGPWTARRWAEGLRSRDRA